MIPCEERKSKFFVSVGGAVVKPDFAGIFNRGISAASYCPKDFRDLAFGGMDGSSILPKQARYQLRYTRLWNFLIVVMRKNVPSNENSLK